MGNPTWEYDKMLFAEHGLTSHLLFDDSTAHQSPFDDQYLDQDQDFEMGGDEYDYLDDPGEVDEYEVQEVSRGTPLPFTQYHPFPSPLAFNPVPRYFTPSLHPLLATLSRDTLPLPFTKYHPFPSPLAFNPVPRYFTPSLHQVSPLPFTPCL